MQSENLDEQFEQPKGFATLIVKPLGMTILDRIIPLIEEKSTIVAVKDIHNASTEQVSAHYQNLAIPIMKPHYPALLKYMSGKDLKVLVVEDKFCQNPDEFPVILKRDLIGNVIPLFALSGTIRSLALDLVLPFLQVITYADGEIVGQPFVYDNLIHSSKSLREALHEMNVWFGEGDLTERYNIIYKKIQDDK